MYRFIKYKTTYLNGESFISDWVFYPETITDVYDFFEKYTLPAIKTGMDESFWPNFKKYFLNDANHDLDFFEEYLRKNGNSFSFSAWLTAQNYNVPLAFAGQRMGIELLRNRVKDFKDGLTIFHDMGGLRSICMDKRYSTICDTYYKDDLNFPDMERPSIEDVRFIVWDGGKHWYAKIYNFDVVVNGEQKWNTKEEAINAAKSYIDENWS